MTRTTLLLVVALGALRDPCGTETSPAGINGACTRTKDCENGLSCVAGVCSPPEAGPPEAAVPEGGDDASEAGPDDASPAE